MTETWATDNTLLTRCPSALGYYLCWVVTSEYDEDGTPRDRASAPVVLVVDYEGAAPRQVTRITGGRLLWARLRRDEVGR